MLCSGYFEKRLVSIDAYYVSSGSNRLRNACRNRTGSAANIQHRKPWPQQLRKAAVVSLKSSSPKDTRIGPV
jgi:hypothetical protein